jgi:hypothetical protein
VPDPLAALAVFIDFSGVPEDEWHDWYDTEHLPERASLDEFVSASWWRAADLPAASLGLYDLATADALESPGYLALRDAHESPWTTRVHRLRDSVNRPSHRHLCTQVAPGHATTDAATNRLRVLRADVAPTDDDRYAAWLADVVTRLAQVPGAIQARSFATLNADQRLHRHLLVVELAGEPGPGVDAVLGSSPVPTTRSVVETYVRPEDKRSG